MDRLNRRAAALAAALMLSALPHPGQAAAVDVVELTAEQIEAGLASHAFTVTDLVQSYLDRIALYEPNYNAFTYLNPNALADAAAADARIAADGGLTLPLQGVPVVIKDSMNVAGVRTTAGFPGFASESTYTYNGIPHQGLNLVADTDAPIVARLRAAGAIILGKTNLPQFARSAANANNSFDGPTYSAINRAFLPGGSSSGSATATSGSFAALGMAEETGGSIENPAGAQALVGVKTTFGLVPTSGGVPLSGSTRDVFGPVAKTVKDAALALGVIAGADPSDPKTAISTVAAGNIPAAGYVAGLSTSSLQGKRFGVWSAGFKNVNLTPETQTLYDNAVAALVSQGATPVSDTFVGSNFLTLAASANFTSVGTSSPYDLDQWFKSLGPGAAAHSAAEYKALTGIDLFAANGPLIGTVTPALTAALADTSVLPDISGFFNGRAALLAEFRKVMTDFDLDGFFFPQMWDKIGPLVGGSYRNTTVSEINLLGTPGVDLPGGYYSDGSPFSVIFMGDTFSEADLLSYAYDFEQATHFRQTPTLVVPEPAMTFTTTVLVATALTGRRRR